MAREIPGFGLGHPESHRHAHRHSFRESPLDTLSVFALFCCGFPTTVKRAGWDVVKKRLKSRTQRRGHSFRHAFATQLLEVRYDIRTVQTLVGHKDVKTTMTYMHVSGLLQNLWVNMA